MQTLRGLHVFFFSKNAATCWEIASKSRIVIPAKAGIHRQSEAWIPGFAGMTTGQSGRSRTAM